MSKNAEINTYNGCYMNKIHFMEHDDNFVHYNIKQSQDYLKSFYDLQMENERQRDEENHYFIES